MQGAGRYAGSMTIDSFLTCFIAMRGPQRVDVGIDVGIQPSLTRLCGCAAIIISTAVPEVVSFC